MRRETLIDFFEDFAALDGPFLVHDDGYRVREYTYAQIAALARAFARRLRAAEFVQGDALVVWSENRPEWIVALWGALLEGVVVVPIDFRVSADFVWRVRNKTNARAILTGDDAKLDAAGRDAPIWPISELASPLAETRPATLDARPGSMDRPPAAPDLGPGSIDPGLAGLEPGPGGTVPEPVTRAPGPDIGPDTLAEIIFTSGATAEPKGVVITHRNVLANIVPIEREILKYRRYARPLFPIRFLNLLPLSHMFGQAMATFIPPMLPGVVVFSHSYNPQEIVRQIHSHRVSVLVCVPKVLDVMKEHMARAVPEAAVPSAEPMHWIKRWWIYRRAHRLLGWKFWAFVVGAAPLDPALEEYWGRLGFAVIQGYGLTETAPIVTLNHPFSSRRGTVGRPIAGVQVKIAEDGEILVRGENVTTGYYKAPQETAAAFEDGWLHTGDIGSLDEAGRLTIRGRKKEMIVTPEGLNVFPDDVERVVDAQPGVRESAVVGVGAAGSREERPHAVLVLAPGADAEQIVRRANGLLEDHQRIRSFSIWPGDRLPRTESTGKLRRKDVQQWVSSGRRPAREPAAVASVAAVVVRFAPQRNITPDTTIEELGLSSLERIELMMALEEAFDTSIDEMAFAGAKTVSDLERLVEQGAADFGPAAPPSPPASAREAQGLGPGTRKLGPRTRDAGPGTRFDFPRWNRSLPARALRRASLATWILPPARLFAWTRVEGLEHLRRLRGPVIFAANHQSHLDTPVIMWALPARWRYRLAPAMAKEFFKAHFFPEQHTRPQWLMNSLNYYLACLFFNAFPLPQREAGARQTLRYAGELVGAGYSILIFPEGRRTEEGEIGHFLPGVGMMASRLGVPVVPVRLEGVDKVLHLRSNIPRPGPVRVAFGAPLTLQGDDHAALARQVEESVRQL